MRPDLPGDLDDKFEVNPTDKVDDLAEEAVGQAKGGLNRLRNKVKNALRKRKMKKAKKGMKKAAEKTAKKATKKTAKMAAKYAGKAILKAGMFIGKGILSLLTPFLPILIPVGIGILAIWILTNVMPSFGIKYWFDEVAETNISEVLDKPFDEQVTGRVNAELNRYYDYVAAIGTNQNKYMLDTKEKKSEVLFSSIDQYEENPICTTYDPGWINKFYEYDLFDGGDSLPADIFEKTDCIRSYDFGEFSDSKSSPNLNGAIVEKAALMNGSDESYDSELITSQEHFDFFVDSAEEGSYILPAPVKYEYDEAEKVAVKNAGAVKDHFDREQYFSISGDLLYMLNKVVCGDEKTYPYPFTRPIPTDENGNFDRFYRANGIDYEKNGLGSIFYYKKDYIYKKEISWVTEQTTKKMHDVIKEKELLEEIEIYEDDLDEIRDMIINYPTESDMADTSTSDVSLGVHEEMQTKESLQLEKENALEKIDELEVELDLVRKDTWYIPVLTHKQVVNEKREEIYLLDKVITFAGVYYFDYEYSYKKVEQRRNVNNFSEGSRKNREGELIQTFSINQIDRWRFEPVPLDITFSDTGLSYFADYLNGFNVKLPEADSGMIDKNFVEFAENNLIGSKREDLRLETYKSVLQSIAQQSSMEYELLKAIVSEDLVKDLDYISPEEFASAADQITDELSLIYNEKTNGNEYPWIDAMREYYGNYYDAREEIDYKISNVLEYYYGDSMEFIEYSYGDDDLYKEPETKWVGAERLMNEVSDDDVDYILNSAKAFTVRLPLSTVEKIDLGFWEENYAENMFVNGYYSGYVETEFFNGALIAMEGLPFVGKGDERITSPFGMRVHPTTGEYKMHHGVDIGIPIGTPLVSTEEGRVAFVGYCSGYGKYMYVLHHEYLTVYAHCNQIMVKKGDLVKNGQPLALSGNTGNSTGPHLHFEVRLNEDYLDFETMDFAILENYAKSNKKYADPERMFVKISELQH